MHEQYNEHKHVGYFIHFSILSSILTSTIYEADSKWNPAQSELIKEVESYRLIFPREAKTVVIYITIVIESVLQ